MKRFFPLPSNRTSCILKVRRARDPFCTAFTLIELLTVLAIISILSALAIPALQGLRNSENVNQAVSGISLLIGEARAYAMAHNTYVWVGFYPNPTAQTLTVGAVAGISGMSDDLTSSSPTYAPLAKLQTYGYLSLSGSLNIANMPPATDISTSMAWTFSQTVGAQTVPFTKILQFNPQGEASVSSGTAHWIQIGLQPVHGGKSSPNVAVIQVGTLSGQVQIFRP